MYQIHMLNTCSTHVIHIKTLHKCGTIGHVLVCAKSFTPTKCNGPPFTDISLYLLSLLFCYSWRLCNALIRLGSFSFLPQPSVSNSQSKHKQIHLLFSNEIPKNLTRSYGGNVDLLTSLVTCTEHYTSCSLNMPCHWIFQPSKPCFFYL